MVEPGVRGGRFYECNRGKIPAGSPAGSGLGRGGRADLDDPLGGMVGVGALLGEQRRAVLGRFALGERSWEFTLALASAVVDTGLDLQPAAEASSMARAVRDVPIELKVAFGPIKVQAGDVGRLDADGRLWVVEMGDYPLGPTGGRVKVLSDLDGDGRYDGHTETFRASAVPDPFSLARWALPLGGKLVTLDDAEQYLGG